MKYKALGCVALGVAALTLASCDFSVPKSLRVKASPTVNAAFGSKEFKLSDEFSVGDLTDSFGDSSSTVKVYDYLDGTSSTEYNIQKFLINMKVMDVPIDFNEYFTDFNFNTDLSSQLGEQSFDIPSVDISQSGSSPFDINGIIGDQLDAGAATGILMAETGSATTISATIPDTVISASGFDTVTFSSGSMNISVSVTGETLGYALSVTNVAILNGSTVISQVAASVNAVTGGVVTLPLAGVTLPSTFTLRVTASTSGGTEWHPITLNVDPAFSDCTVSAATGFSIANETVSIGPTQLDFSPGSGFVSAVIGEGSITVDVPFPSNVTGCTRTINLSITQPGGLSLSNTFDLADGPADFNLAGESLSTSAITVSGTITINGTDVDATGLDSNPIDIAWSSSANIDNFTSIVLDAADADLSISQTIEQSLSDIAAWVKWINFDRVGFSLNFVNGLPTGNNLTMTVSSTAFALGPLTYTLTPDNPATGAQEYTAVTAFKGAGDNDPGDSDPATNGEANDYQLVVDDSTLIDYTITIEPENLAGGEVTLYNIAPGGHYVFAENEIDFVTEWARASIDPGTPFTGSFPEGSGDTIDMSMLKDIVSGTVKLDGIEARLYLNKFTTGAFDLQGNILASYNDGADSVAMLGGLNGSRVPVSFATTMPVFRDSGEYNTAWVNDVGEAVFVDKPGYTQADAPLPDTYQEISDMDTILNDAPADLKITYDFDATALEVTPAALATNTRLQGDLVLILPFVLKASADSILPLDTYLPDLTEDIFGREEIGGETETDKALESLSSMSMTLAITNELGVGVSAFLYQGVDSSNPEWESNHFEIDNLPPQNGTYPIQTQTLGLERSDVEFIKNHLFMPKVQILLPEGTYPLSRTGGITIGVTATIRTEVDQTVDF